MFIFLFVVEIIKVSLLNIVFELKNDLNFLKDLGVSMLFIIWK